MNCKKCGIQIVRLVLSDAHKLELWALLSQDMRLFAMNKLVKYGYSLFEAKAVIPHLNLNFQKCSNCNSDLSSEENVSCGHCSSFNYNKKLEPPFNKSFCSALEYEISQYSEKKSTAFWCDGVDHLPKEILSLTKSNISFNKELRTKVWVGKDGQEEYEMCLKFGPIALDYYQNEQPLYASIPEGGEWVIVDIENKLIQVTLN